MWRLRIAKGSEDPLIHSLNENVGRQTWEFEEGGGTADERFEVNRLREHFTSNRWTKRHSSDALMRLQVRDRYLGQIGCDHNTQHTNTPSHDNCAQTVACHLQVHPHLWLPQLEIPRLLKHHHHATAL